MELRSVLQPYVTGLPGGLERIRTLAALRSELPELLDELIDEAVHAARQGGSGWDEIREALDGPPRVRPVDRPRSPLPPSTGSGVRQHDGKYQRLWAWLVDQPDDEVELSFGEIERILGFDLPPSSREHLPHWHGYKGSAVARSIIDAGFKARNVDLAGERLTLTRVAR